MYKKTSRPQQQQQQQQQQQHQWRCCFVHSPHLRGCRQGTTEPVRPVQAAAWGGCCDGAAGV
jgi:hypothetical protein